MRWQLAALWAGTLCVVLVAHYGLRLGDWPAGWGFSIVDQVTNGMNWVTTQLTGVSQSLSSFLTLHVLNPLQSFLGDLPWWLLAGLVGVVAWARGGPRRALLLVGCVALIGLMQAPVGYTYQGTTSYDFAAWDDAMVTLSLVIVALILDLVLGSRSGLPPTAGASSTTHCAQSSTSCRRCLHSST